jgi:hypothetical protein
MNLPFFKRASQSAINKIVPEAGIPTVGIEPDQTVIDHSAIIAERDSIRAEFDLLKATSATLISDLEAKANGFAKEIEQLKADADKAKELYEKTREEITQEIRQHEVASVAAAQGIPPESIVPAQMENAPATKEEKLADLQKQLAQTNDPAERFRIGQETRKVLSAN